jgi:hypothetical protein
MYVVTVLLLVAFVFGGFCLRANFRQHTVEFIAVGVRHGLASTYPSFSFFSFLLFFLLC